MKIRAESGIQPGISREWSQRSQKYTEYSKKSMSKFILPETHPRPISEQEWVSLKNKSFRQTKKGKTCLDQEGQVLFFTEGRHSLLLVGGICPGLPLNLLHLFEQDGLQDALVEDGVTTSQGAVEDIQICECTANVKKDVEALLTQPPLGREDRPEELKTAEIQSFSKCKYTSSNFPKLTVRAFRKNGTRNRKANRKQGRFRMVAV